MNLSLAGMVTPVAKKTCAPRSCSGRGRILWALGFFFFCMMTTWNAVAMDGSLGKDPKAVPPSGGALPGVGSHGKSPVSGDSVDSCRVFDVSVLMISRNAGSSADFGEAIEGLHLGNAEDRMKYHVDVCESETGLVVFDRSFPFVEQMFLQGGRRPAYARKIGFQKVQQGCMVVPVAIDDGVRLHLSFWQGRVSDQRWTSDAGALQTEDHRGATTLTMPFGKWTRVTTISTEDGLGNPDGGGRRLGNANESWSVWVKVVEN